MSNSLQANQRMNRILDSPGKPKDNTYLQYTINIPSKLSVIQPRVAQVWKWNEIGFGTNIKWYKVFCTYNLCPVKCAWKLQTENQTPLWGILLVLTLAEDHYGSPIKRVFPRYPLQHHTVLSSPLHTINLYG